MNALWLVGDVVKRSASDEDPERSLLGFRLASIRLRTAVAALGWKQSGRHNVYWVPGAGGPGIDWGAARVCVASKFYHDYPLEPWIETCRAAREHGCPLVIDICDYPYHRNVPKIHSFYNEALKACDAVVVNSQRMAEMMASHAARQPLVIEDAILAAPRNPAFAPQSRLELLWFGHPSNLPFLGACLEGLVRFAGQRRCRLTVVTADDTDAAAWVRDIDARHAPAFEARFTPWSLDATRLALRKCDLVLLPSDPAHPLKTGASANRIAETLNAGRFPVASALPSYLPFAEAAWLGADVVEGVKWALANRGEALARIRRGQALVAERFSAERIGRQWLDLFDSLGRSRAPSG